MPSHLRGLNEPDNARFQARMEHRDNRAEIAQLRAELHQLRREIQQDRSDLPGWLFGFWIALFALMVAMIGLGEGPLSH